MKNFRNTMEQYRIGGQIKKVSLNLLSQHASGIVLLGLADDQGIKNVNGRSGARLAPSLIREKLFKLIAPNLSVPLYDLGDIAGESEVKQTHQSAREWIAEIHQAKHIPLLFGGGHDLAYPEARALLDTQKGALGFINVDAHLDLRPTELGITSGSPWNLLLQERDFHSRRCHLVEFGIQSHCNSPELFEIAKKNKVEIISLDRIVSGKTGPAAQFSKSLKTLSKSKKKIQVSLDIDSVQSSQAPGCSAPQVLGFSASDFIRFSEISGLSPQVASFGIYEVSPPLDIAEATVRLAAQAALAFIQGVARRKSRL